MAEKTSAAGALRCAIVTPEKTVVDEPAVSVVITAADGELGILPRRQPLIARLAFGELRFTPPSGGNPKRFYVEGGFAQVSDNKVTILTPHAVAAEALDAADIDQKLAAVAKPADAAPAVSAQKSVQALKAQQRIAQKR